MRKMNRFPSGEELKGEPLLSRIFFKVYELFQKTFSFGEAVFVEIT